MENAGETVIDGIEPLTGAPIYSLYGKQKKPTSDMLNNLDILVFDMQDIGVRYYTYLSTLTYILETAAENGIPVIILDGINPLGRKVQGPILEEEFISFVGMHPLPVLHGMTLGELAQMINGESWLNSKVKCNLKVIEILNYKRDYNYSLLIKPSPNLPNEKSISLYPSLCLFEGTNVSVGRGTTNQFQVIGSPYLDQNIYSFTFIPKPNQGSKYPPHNNIKCYGLDLRDKLVERKLNLSYIIDAYKNTKNKSEFFNNYFIKLSGTKDLKTQIINNTPEEIIRKSWKDKIDEFKLIRKKYLIYK